MPPPAFHFAEVAAATALRPWLLSWWEFRVGTEAPKEHHVPPDGCTNLVLANPGTAHQVLLALGPFTAPRVVPAQPGMCTTGLRLHPAATPVLLRRDAEALVNEMAPVQAVGGIAASDLIAVLALPTLESIAQAGDTLFLTGAETLPQPDPLATAALDRIWRTHGRAPLPGIAAQLGCSPRTMLRRVRAASGLSPKQYARIIRFHAAVSGMIDEDARIAHLAAKGGYADQPHFHHEVSALTGLTPAALAKRVRSTEHRLVTERLARWPEGRK